MKHLVLACTIFCIPLNGFGQIQKVYEWPSLAESRDPDIRIFSNEGEDTIHVVRINKAEARGNYYWERSLWDKAATEYIVALSIHEITEKYCDDCHELLSLINYRIGMCYFHTDKFAQAIPYFTKSINLFSNNAYFLIKYSTKLKHPNIIPSDTSSYYVSALSLSFERHAPVIVYRGWAKMELEDFYGAEKDFKTGIKLEENVEFYNLYGRLLGNTKRFQEALNIFNKAISIDKDNGRAFYYRGMTKINLKDKPGGCQDLSKAGELGIEDAYKMIKLNCNK